MRFSQGWSILIGAAIAALIHNLLILFLSRYVNQPMVLGAIALGAWVILGVMGGVVSSSITLYGPVEAAWGAGILAPFLSIATDLRYYPNLWLFSSFGSFVFFVLSLTLSIAGASAVVFLNPALRSRRRRLRRVK